MVGAQELALIEKTDDGENKWRDQKELQKVFAKYRKGSGKDGDLTLMRGRVGEALRETFNPFLPLFLKPPLLLLTSTRTGFAFIQLGSSRRGTLLCHPQV